MGRGGDAAEATKEKAYEAKNAASDKGRDAVEATKEKGREAKDAAAGTAQYTMDTARSGADQTGGYIAQTAEVAKQKAGAAAQYAMDTAVAGKDKTGSLLVQAGETVKGAVVGAKDAVVNTLGMGGDNTTTGTGKDTTSATDKSYGWQSEFQQENYLLDRATFGPLFDAYDDDMDGCSTELVDVFLGTPEQQKSDQFANCFCEALNAFSEDTPERVSHAYDVDTKGRIDESVHVFASPPQQQPYEAKQQESGPLPKCFSKLTYSAEKPTDDIFFTSEQKYDTEVLVVCLKNASDNAVSEVATDLTFPLGPLIHADRSIKLTNEKSTHAASILCVHEAIMHCHDERSKLHIKTQDVFTNKHDITSPCDLNNGKKVPFVLLYQLPQSSVSYIFDPGIDWSSYKKAALFSLESTFCYNYPPAIIQEHFFFVGVLT